MEIGSECQTKIKLMYLGLGGLQFWNCELWTRIGLNLETIINNFIRKTIMIEIWFTSFISFYIFKLKIESTKKSLQI